MKKIFLVLTLLVSGFGFADFSISTFQCVLISDQEPKNLSNTPTIRINEKTKTMRVDMFPEAKYEEIKPEPPVMSKDTVGWEVEFELAGGLFIVELYYDMSARVYERWNGESYESSFDCRLGSNKY